MSDDRQGRVHVEIYFEVRERVARMAKRKRRPQYKVVSELLTRALDVVEAEDLAAYNARREGR